LDNYIKTESLSIIKYLTNPLRLKDIEFSGKGWDCFERSVRLKVNGQEVVVARAPEEP